MPSHRRFSGITKRCQPYSIFSRYFLPSRSDEFITRQRQHVETGKRIKQELEDEREYVLQLLEEVNNKRRKKVASRAEPQSRLAPIKEYEEILKTYDTLRNRVGLTMFYELATGLILSCQLDQIDVHLDEVSDKFRTSACHENTGFYGLADWAKHALTIYEHFCDGIAGASVFGAGITYTTIFSGTRGNIGLMCWAFTLFNVAFVIAIVVRSILIWCSRLPLPNKTFATALFWEVMIQFALILAFGSTTAALLLLNLTILLFSGTDVQEVQMNLSSRPPGIIAIFVLAGAMVTVTICLFLGWWSNDFKPPQRQHERRIRKTEELFV
ncbi:hypothetical protein D9758_007536 [Tetrapyrgos nigripes]|uniref:Uncharacterized protein n=1 Tax=Tetrapyrgos nigripes TaxID=182062 RepID=A0A8H5G3M6_9AGAR|nr:hypothetical protein D9758_007536 [Tetrapyrgos nigripes]